MNADEFESKTTPSAQRSRLAPHWSDITRLRARGYSLVQICAFLKSNGVQISIDGLSKYIRRRRGGEPVVLTPQARPPTHRGESTGGAAEEEEMAGKSPTERGRAKRERKAARYVGEGGNSILNIVKEKK